MPADLSKSEADMTASDPTPQPQTADAYEPPSPTEEVEEAALFAGLAVAGALRAIEVFAVVLLALLVCPPLLILVVVVVVPLVAIALLLALVSATLAAPYLLVRHLRGHRGGHAALFAHRLRHAGHALLDLAPHRIHADAHKFHHRR
jgi:hypothetical protein